MANHFQRNGVYKAPLIGGAEVNIDDPLLLPSKEGPKSPHIGYQTPGKRAGGGAKRGHILLKLVSVSRSKIGIPR